MDQYNKKKTHGFKFNLRGFIVGNGVTNWKYDGDPAYIQMAFGNSLFGTKLQQSIKENNCTFYYFDYAYSDTYDERIRECNHIFDKFWQLTTYINIYDVYRRCFGADTLVKTHHEVTVGSEVKKYRA